jgi:RNA polymerase sigma-70 factor (ECF subfamily)
MTMPASRSHAALEAVYRQHGRRVLATLIRLLGDFDTAEEALHDACAAAAEKWPSEGEPNNPYAWLVSAGRFKTIDRWRRRARLDATLRELATEHDIDDAAFVDEPDAINDDELRLIFTCCHPALAPDARIALTLREVGGLTTEEIARAYLVPTPTIAQRIVRAKAKIRDDAIPYEVPPLDQLPARLESALHVLYLIFNEGYAATAGETLTRSELSQEALRLCRLVAGLLDDAEVNGLLALMLLHEARRESRTTPTGEFVLLEDQDRSKWDRVQIAEAEALVERALQSRRFGPYTLQAAIAAVHVSAANAGNTDWAQIVALYDVLVRADPSPVVKLNRAVAVAMADGPAKGLATIDEVLATGLLDAYYLAHSARADMCRRLGRNEEARIAYERALQLVRQGPERRFLERRIAELGRSPTPQGS